MIWMCFGLVKKNQKNKVLNLAKKLKLPPKKLILTQKSHIFLFFDLKSNKIVCTYPRLTVYIVNESL